MMKTLKRTAFVAGAATTASVVMATGIILREINIKKQKEMLVKLTATTSRINIIQRYVENFVAVKTEDLEYMMESATYKKLLDDCYISEKIAYYIMGAEEFISDELKKNMKSETERLYNLYVKGDKTDNSVVKYRERVQAEVDELKKKAK